MSLSTRQLKLALWCATQELAARREGKAPGVKPWNADLVRALELELAVSASGQSEVGEVPGLDHDEWIGTVEAARILRWHERKVRRHKSDLGGRKISGQLVFRASTVHTYAERMTHARTVA